MLVGSLFNIFIVFRRLTYIIVFGLRSSHRLRRWWCDGDGADVCVSAYLQVKVHPHSQVSELLHPPFDLIFYCHSLPSLQRCNTTCAMCVHAVRAFQKVHCCRLSFVFLAIVRLTLMFFFLRTIGCILCCVHITQSSQTLVLHFNGAHRKIIQRAILPVATWNSLSFSDFFSNLYFCATLNMAYIRCIALARLRSLVPSMRQSYCVCVCMCERMTSTLLSQQKFNRNDCICFSKMFA